MMAAADPLSDAFSALADPTRRAMVQRLADGDATVTQLAAPHDMSVQAISKHLHVLEEAGIVSRSRDGQTRPAHLEAEVFELLDVWLARHRRRIEQRYQRLDHLLANDAPVRPPQAPPTPAPPHHDTPKDPA